MITRQVIQSCIDELKELTKVDFCVLDNQGMVMGSTTDAPGPDTEVLKSFLDSQADSQIIGSNYLFKVKEENEPAYVLVSKGSQADSYLMGRIAVNELQHLIVAYREQYNHNDFIQNLLLDNLLLVDIYNRAAKLGIPVQARRIAFVVEVDSDKEREALSALKTAFATNMSDYVLAVEEKSIIVIHTFEEGEQISDMTEIAEMIETIMDNDLMIKSRVACGTAVDELKELSKSYKEAKMAMEVGKIFYADQHIIKYDSLGIGRLIYQLPVNLCRIFIDEIFNGGLPEEIDSEIITSVNAFLDNKFNTSETARFLYIHRNTLVYRIEKLKAATGLDVREFDDALTFKIAMMVTDYINYMDQNGS